MRSLALLLLALASAQTVVSPAGAFMSPNPSEAELRALDQHNWTSLHHAAVPRGLSSLAKTRCSRVSRVPQCVSQYSV